MIFNMSYCSRVAKNILYIILILIGLYVAIKLSVFYMPFLIAFLISLLIEPCIKFIMKKTTLTRRTSSIIIFLIVTLILLATISWLILTLITEASSLLEGFNEYIDKIYKIIQDISSNINLENFQVNQEIQHILENSVDSVLSTVSEQIKEFLTNLINFITSIPAMFISLGITVIALYFICVDKIYIVDQIEHHLPKLWVKRIFIHFKELTKSLGRYLKAEATLVLTSFIISLIGLYILELLNFEIPYPLLMALFIGFVDALPILGSGTVMIPWSIIAAINGDINLALGLIGLLIVMSVVRQLIEPKIVSKNIGVHPIFTLIAMYTGFRVMGVLGLLVGPIALIIVKNIFASLIDQGVFKSIFEKT